jgi:hypothetical protein
MEDDEEDGDENNIPDLAHLYEAGAFDDDEPMDETEENAVEEQPHGELGQVLLDAQKDSKTLVESKKFEKILEDHKKLGSTLGLLQWKATNGVTDKGFEELLGIIKNMLPKGNELPSTTYEAKKVVRPLGLEVQKIHTCPNDCILYHGDEYEKLDVCPVCGAKRYKIRQNNTGDVNGELPTKKSPLRLCGISL